MVACQHNSISILLLSPPDSVRFRFCWLFYFVFISLYFGYVLVCTVLPWELPIEKGKMGICSSQMSRKNGNFFPYRPSIMVVHSDGRLEEFNQPIRASHILSQHPNSFLCSSESMYVDSIVPQIPEDEELELGQIYFLLPMSQSHKVLTLQDLCGLAIKASLALGFTTPNNATIKRTPSIYNVNVAKLIGLPSSYFVSDPSRV
uniref:Uncharacterized protein n=1 Tax=Opuntia streptacantha TaxID=393608 RepID=A0A7C8YQ89_OPUST